MTERERKILAAEKELIELLSPGVRLDATQTESPAYVTGFLQGLLSAQPTPVPTPRTPSAAAGAGAGGAAAARESMIRNLEGVARTARGDTL